MVVYEVGIITEGGLPILNVNLRLEGQKADPALQAGFLTALQQFVGSAFSDETRSFIMKRYNIFLMKIELEAENEEAHIYAVGDKKAREKINEKLDDLIFTDDGKYYAPNPEKLKRSVWV